MPSEAELEEAALQLSDEWFAQGGEVTEDQKESLALILAGAEFRLMPATVDGMSETKT